MMSRIAVALGLLIGAAALAQGPTEAQRLEQSKRRAYIFGTEPGRPSKPLRRDNITDEEVREVQAAALEVYPDAIVNISGVTDSCGCEEGNCTAQVWIALYRPSRTTGLMLSKISGHWTIGAVQQWWLRYDEHRGRFPGFGSTEKRLAWQREDQQLLDSFPVCQSAGQ